ncbi:DUF998 domain-containing protein [Pseudoxanthomonas winnipegensis]|uniref:DUF998 domain-containing protein n=1 Tax=Pseudoxanthomonas winnipegensis TaxID=2480810 RepID=A0A4Q8L9Z4_9GAMM|nr:DUF998 domain-containing protein [Pseudoxanthomonas winnipegensis]RZZ82779.1 DUF998 domain-containing protein [Pseudoxanthomonas winnipegensis]TAA24930.1 DUF998 domain-containing protein [Pseudoxanthomonas winnipegensis]TAA39396.1 DUF998 domain-containing protein [Pseudoxanthomonas winnipegensis]TBV75218.1 DUF998 domain-containing protein [Pseudoxanthomonas winnipegensis]
MTARVRRRWWRGCVPAAAALWVGALLGFGAALPGYVQSVHPVALLGAQGIAGAMAFNLFGFVLPGALCAVVAVSLRLRLPLHTGWRQRIGAQLMFLSTLGFVAMGVFRLDPVRLEGTQTLLHATAWGLWWSTALASALLLAGGLRRDPAWRGLVRGGPPLAGLAVLFALVLPAVLPDGLSQRVAILAWLGWCGLAAVSGPDRPLTATLRG